MTVRACESLVELLDERSTRAALHAVDEAGEQQRLVCSHKELVALVRSFDATAMARAGVGAGARVAVALDNTCAQAVAFLSLACAGYVFAPLSRKLTRGEYDFEYADLPAAALVVHEHDDDSLLAVAVARARHVPVVTANRLRGCPAGAFTLASQGAGGVQPPASPTNVAMVLHTSGTTSKPKTVPLTHANLCYGAQYIAKTLQLSESDVAINVMPLFHIHGLAVNLLASLAAGASVMCAGTLDSIGLVRFFDLLEQSTPRPNWYSAVPTMHQMIVSYSKSRPLGDHSIGLVRNCSAALLPTVARALEATFGEVKVLPTYAMSESMPICSNPRFGGVRKLESVGPAAGPSILILEAHPGNAAVAQGSEGEVCVAGLCVTSGYEQRQGRPDPNESAFVLTDGTRYLRTGDKGWIDEDGHLHLSGRFKEVINRGGEKFSPFPVEDALLSHPAVDRVVAFAAPHETLGEVVGVGVVLQSGRTTTLRELRAWCVASEQVNDRALPEVLCILSSIPVGPTGKPARIGLAKNLGLTASVVEEKPTFDLGCEEALRRVDPAPLPAVQPTVAAAAVERDAEDPLDFLMVSGHSTTSRISLSNNEELASAAEVASYGGVDSLALMMGRGSSSKSKPEEGHHRQHNVYMVAMFALLLNWCFDAGNYKKMIKKSDVDSGEYGDVSVLSMFFGEPQKIAMPIFFGLSGLGDEAHDGRTFDATVHLFAAVALALYVAMRLELLIMPPLYAALFDGGLHGDNEVHFWFLPALVLVKATRYCLRRARDVVVANGFKIRNREAELCGLALCAFAYLSPTVTRSANAHIAGYGLRQYRNIFWYFLGPPLFRRANALVPSLGFYGQKRYRKRDFAALFAVAVRFVAAILTVRRIGQYKILCHGHNPGIMSNFGRWSLCILATCPMAFCSETQNYGLITDVLTAVWCLTVICALLHLAPARRVFCITRMGENTITVYCFNWLFRPLQIRATWALVHPENSVLSLVPCLLLYQLFLSQPVVPAITALIFRAKEAVGARRTALPAKNRREEDDEERRGLLLGSSREEPQVAYYGSSL